MGLMGGGGRPLERNAGALFLLNSNHGDASKAKGVSASAAFVFVVVFSTARGV